jgi:putative hydrolase of the HAD superfamily
MEATPRGWVIFDGDNTLWDVESLYDQARHKLCALIESLGYSAAAADTYQRARDTALHAHYAYRPARFPQSFADTLRHFTGRTDPALESVARALAEKVFTSIASPASDVDEVLRRVHGHYIAGLLTAGDPVVQAHRLQTFGRIDQFVAVQIVEQKNSEVLRTFLADRRIDPSSCWVVGDSLRSDIEPAIALGIRAIHVNVSNWHPIERGDRVLPTGVHQAATLLDVCEILGC